MDTSRRVSHYRTVKVGENIRANFLDCTDSDGHHYVSIELRRQAAQGPMWFIKTDLDRLEGVVKRADEIMKSPNGLGAAFRDETINDFKVTFSPWPTKGTPESLALFLDAPGPNRQVFGISLDRLKAVMREGHAIERELKCDQKEWQMLVYASSLAKDQVGLHRATVFKSVESVEEAQRILKDNEGLGLYSEPRRRPLENGTIITVHPENTVELPTGKRRTVEGQVIHNELDGQRRSEHFVVARWGFPGRPPVNGEPVMWTGNGEAANNEFEDYRAMPIGARGKGEPSEAMYVLLKKDADLVQNATVEASSPNRLDMTELLPSKDAAERQHREITVRWNKQKLGLDQRRHEF